MALVFEGIKNLHVPRGKAAGDRVELELLVEPRGKEIVLLEQEHLLREAKLAGYKISD